jgi:hypothetical protein
VSRLCGGQGPGQRRAKLRHHQITRSVTEARWPPRGSPVGNLQPVPPVGGGCRWMNLLVEGAAEGARAGHGQLTNNNACLVESLVARSPHEMTQKWLPRWGRSARGETGPLQMQLAAHTPAHAQCPREKLAGVSGATRVGPRQRFQGHFHVFSKSLRYRPVFFVSSLSALLLTDRRLLCQRCRRRRVARSGRSPGRIHEPSFRKRGRRM